jgi:hypothetical protein
MSAVLILSQSPRFHTALHCPSIYDPRGKVNKVKQVIVTTYDKAKGAGKTRCKHEECMGTPYYWWKEGEDLIK